MEKKNLSFAYKILNKTFFKLNVWIHLKEQMYET